MSYNPAKRGPTKHMNFGVLAGAAMDPAVKKFAVEDPLSSHVHQVVTNHGYTHHRDLGSKGGVSGKVYHHPDGHSVQILQDDGGGGFSIEHRNANGVRSEHKSPGHLDKHLSAIHGAKHSDGKPGATFAARIPLHSGAHEILTRHGYKHSSRKAESVADDIPGHWTTQEYSHPSGWRASVRVTGHERGHVHHYHPEGEGTHHPLSKLSGLESRLKDVHK